MDFQIEEATPTIEKRPPSPEVSDRHIQSEYERQAAQERHWIEINAGVDDPDPTVYVGVNGVSYWIRKGERVPLPLCAIESLKNAKVNTTKYNVETGKAEQISYLRFPFSDFGPASPAEVKAFFKKQAEKSPDQQSVTER